MLRICLIIAIVGGLAAGVINFVKVQEVIKTVVGQRDDERSKKETALRERDTARKELAATKKELESTQGKLAQMTTERDTEKARATELDKRATDLTAQLNRTRDDRDKAQQKLAQWDQMGVTPLQVKGIMEDLKKVTGERNTLIAENKLLDKKRLELQAKLAEFVGLDQPPVLPTGLKGKVLVVDPKYDFVVLDIGENKGVLPRGELMVDRAGKLIAKVRISSVQKDRSIANIMPGWTLGDVMEGDQVIY
jgi:hypothetical protein